jgi:hypothetical protein
MEEKKSASWWKKEHGGKENLNTETGVGKQDAKETPPPANLANFLVIAQSSLPLFVVADCMAPACPEVWYLFGCVFDGFVYFDRHRRWYSEYFVT